MKIAIIPARSGSQRIPRKNIQNFCGKPMLAWPIQAAIKSGCFDKIIVSTDDHEIASIAQTYGAETPFLRPSELSDHHTPTRPVINHAIIEAERHWGKVKQVCCLYATAPLVQPNDLKKGLETLLSSDVDFVFSVTSFTFPIQRALRILPNGGVTMYHPEYKDTRSQDLESAYHDAGQFYWGHAEAFLQGSSMYSSRSRSYLIPRHRVQDIDTQEDWQRAEQLMQLYLTHEQTIEHS